MEQSQLNKKAQSVKSHNKLVKRLATHLAAGAVALTVAIGSTQMSFSSASTSNDESVAPAQTVQTSVTTTTSAQTQIAEVTQRWWKAGISEYDLVEYTDTEVELPVEVVPEEPFPDIRFTVEKPSSYGAVANAQVVSHKNYGTRSIANEYYTVKSLTTGTRVSGNGFDMVCKILNGEMGPSFSEEALKAQAVAIYSYLRYCDDNGLVPVVATRGSYNDKIKNAVKAVEGQMLTYDGKVINAVFCASTAGNTTSSASVWGGSLPYLKGVTSEYDYLDPNYGVKRTFTAAQLKRIIESKTNIKLSNSDVENWFEIVNYTNGKYVGEIKIAGNTHARVNGRNVKLTGAVLRASILGNSTLRSTAFDISYSNGVFTFTTYGYGHGVGMSQWGANLLAIHGGLKYDQILLYYYQGARLSCSGVNGEAVDRFGEDDTADKQEATPGDLPEKEEEKKPQQSVTVTTKVTTSVTTTTSKTQTEPKTETTTQTTTETTPAVTTAPPVEAPEIVETTVSTYETSAQQSELAVLE